jgi:hypothetical protein
LEKLVEIGMQNPEERVVVEGRRLCRMFALVEQNLLLGPFSLNDEKIDLVVFK